MPNPDLQSNLIMPQAIGLVITGDEKVNLCPVNWHIVSTKYESPMTVCVGLSHGHYTLEVIEKTEEFVFAYPTRDQLKDTLFCGTVSGRDVDKLKKTSFEFADSQKVSPPLLKEAVLNLECKLDQKIVMGNYTILVGIVEAVHESDKSPLDKIYSLGDQNYGVVSEMQIFSKREIAF
jgi:flavin reductase (DIM6/NTAB) family NADH-FMN oxidoreductase RutF